MWDGIYAADEQRRIVEEMYKRSYALVKKATTVYPLFVFSLTDEEMTQFVPELPWSIRTMLLNWAWWPFYKSHVCMYVCITSRRYLYIAI